MLYVETGYFDLIIQTELIDWKLYTTDDYIAVLAIKILFIKNDMKINERFEKMYHPPTICRHGLLFIFIHKINHSLMFLVFFVHHNNYKNVLHARTRTGSTHNMRCSCVNCQTFLT